MPFDKTPLAEPAMEMIAETPEPEAEREPALWPVYLGLAIFLVAMIASVAIFGLPGLYIPAVAFVPVMYLVLIRLTVG